MVAKQSKDQPTKPSMFAKQSKGQPIMARPTLEAAHSAPLLEDAQTRLAALKQRTQAKRKQLAEARLIEEIDQLTKQEQQLDAALQPHARVPVLRARR